MHVLRTFGSFCFLIRFNFEPIRGDIASSPPGLATFDAFGGPLGCEDNAELLAEPLVSLPTYLHACPGSFIAYPSLSMPRLKKTPRTSMCANVAHVVKRNRFKTAQGRGGLEKIQTSFEKKMFSIFFGYVLRQTSFPRSNLWFPVQYVFSKKSFG